MAAELRPLDAEPPAVRPLVLLGASYIASWRLTEVAGRPVVNLGIAGDQTPAYVARFERDVAALQPRAVVIWGIDNDIIRAAEDRIDEARAQVERNLRVLVDLARSHGIEPILVTDLTLRAPARWFEWLAAIVGRLRGREGYQQRINRYILRVNTFIRGYAAEAGVHVLDLHPLVSRRDGMRARRFAKPDGSHLTDEGYRVIEQYAVPRLTEWLSAPAPAARDTRD